MFFLKNNKKEKDGRFWFQKNPKLYIDEEKQIKQRFAGAEKNVENGVLSFFVPTYKTIGNTSEELSFQLVYPVEYDINKEIKIYFINPELNSLLGDNINDFPYVEIDSAGESFLQLSKTLPNDKISGMEVIRKMYVWLQKYQEWKNNSINIKDIKI